MSRVNEGGNMYILKNKLLLLSSVPHFKPVREFLLLRNRGQTRHRGLRRPPWPSR